MTFENCNVKALLKKLVLNETEDRTSKKWHPTLKTRERKVFDLLFTFLNSPYVVSSSNHHNRWEPKKQEQDNAYEIYNILAKEIFYLKANGDLPAGDNLEKIADTSQCKAWFPDWKVCISRNLYAHKQTQFQSKTRSWPQTKDVLFSLRNFCKILQANRNLHMQNTNFPVWPDSEFISLK